MLVAHIHASLEARLEVVADMTSADRALVDLQRDVVPTLEENLFGYLVPREA